MLPKQRIRLNQLSNQKDAFELGKLLESHFRNQALNSAGLRIQGGSAAATWQSQNTVMYVLDGVTKTVAAASGQAVPSAVSWTGASAVYNAGGFLITVDSAGTLATVPATVGAGSSAAIALGNVVWPAVPDGVVVIGVVIIATTAANITFTAASTNLDATSISTTFINVTGPFFPTAPY